MGRKTIYAILPYGTETDGHSSWSSFNGDLFNVVYSSPRNKPTVYASRAKAEAEARRLHGPRRQTRKSWPGKGETYNAWTIAEMTLED